MAKKKTTAKKAEKPIPMAKTFGEVAKKYKVARDTVRRDWKAAGMPALPCTWEEIDKWKATLKPAPNKADENKDPIFRDEAITKARREKYMAEAEIKKAFATVSLHKARLLASDVISLDVVERFIVEFLTEARVQMLRLPEELKAAYPPKWRDQLGVDLRQRLELILKALHGRATTLADIRNE